VAKYTLSAEAVADLDTIWEYVARDDVDAADRIVEAAYRVCTNLAKHPELGPLRRFYSSGPGNIRYFVITEFPNYLIFYRVVADGVEIIRILHGAQDVGDLLAEE
jgi:plasmid stabilization system protein ParE